MGPQNETPPAALNGVSEDAWPLQRERLRPRYVRAAVLFVLTALSTTTMGAVWYLLARTDEMFPAELLPFLGPRTAAAIWQDPRLLEIGLSFSLPLLFILLCHEMGHYVACRYHGLPSSLPYFLPAPVFIGTLGAFIRIRARIRSKRQLLDVGIAGPLAGFVALLPFLLYGVALSEPSAVDIAAEKEDAVAQLLYPGRGLLMLLVSSLIHGPLPEGTVLDLHPFALAAWAGLLATGLNLLPVGQLDGGHVLYALIGRSQHRLALPVWLALCLAALLSLAWVLMCVLLLVLGLRHPPVDDETRPLGPVRRALAISGLVLFFLCFPPVPVEWVLLAS